MSDKYSVASGLASAVGETALEYGIDIGPICSALGLDPTDFSNITGRTSLDRICRLFESCALIANDEGFGLHVAEHFIPGSSGPLGYGLLAAPTALDFFRFLGEHMQYGVELSYSKLMITPAGAELTCVYSPMILKRDQFVDMIMALLVSRMKQFEGLVVDAVEIGLERPRPRNISLFRDRLSRRLSFGRDTITMRLPAEYFACKNPKGDARLFQLMDLQCRALRPERPVSENFLDDLKEFILSRVRENAISLSDAARYFHVSERTLQRRLAELGTSLNDLRDEVRRDLARKLLAESELTAAEIAGRLGYSASSAFTRSTVRWFGVTPKEYRRSSMEIPH